MIKGREVEDIIKNRGFEKGVMYILVTLIERSNSLEKALIDVSQQLNQMVNIIDQFTHVAENMKRSHERMEKRLKGVPDDAPLPVDDRRFDS